MERSTCRLLIALLVATFSDAVFPGAVSAAAASEADTSGAAEALIRWHVSTQKIRAGEARFYVSVDGHDLPREAIAALKDTGIDFRPTNSFKPENPTQHVGADWRITIGPLVRRDDGDYEVQWGYYCGSLCAARSTAIVRHESSGWRVVSSAWQWIS